MLASIDGGTVAAADVHPLSPGPPSFARAAPSPSPSSAASTSAPPAPRLAPPVLAHIVHCFLSFLICNIDRINLSIAVVPMAAHYGWTDAQVGLVQSIFFLGYMLTNVAGGRLADAHGGRRVLAVAVALWSLCTLLTPVAARAGWQPLLAARAALGAGEGAAMPAMNALVAAAVVPAYRARALAFVYSGMYAGSIAGLLASPPLIKAAGFASVFYVFGAVGLVWVVVFLTTTVDPKHLPPDLTAPAPHSASAPAPTSPLAAASENPPPASTQSPAKPTTARELAAQRTDALHNLDLEAANAPPKPSPSSSSSAASDADSTHASLTKALLSHQMSHPLRSAPSSSPSRDAHGTHASGSGPAPGRTPSLAEIFSTRAMWAIIVAHFCCTWGYFVLVAWLPSYFVQRFGVDLSASALYSALPWAAMLLSANVGGAVADRLLASGRLSTTAVRKTMQAVGFLGPAAFLAVVAHVSKVEHAWPLVAAALACSAWSQSGVYANHQDIGPGVAGTLLGISNTFASLPGLIGVYVSGVVLEVTGRHWEAVFYIAIFFYLLGFLFYTAFATSEQIW